MALMEIAIEAAGSLHGRSGVYMGRAMMMSDTFIKPKFLYKLEIIIRD